MTDYKEIKKGIKRIELDKTTRDIKCWFGIIVGTIIGCTAKSFIVGFVIFMIFCLWAAKGYYEIN